MLDGVVLMDIRMPELDGLEATRRIVAAHKNVRVLVLTTFDLDEYVHDALRAAASGFLLKDTPPAELVAAIRVIARGEALLEPGITKRLIEQFARMPEPGRRSTIGRPPVGVAPDRGECSLPQRPDAPRP